jgi:hypothetical protein
MKRATLTVILLLSACAMPSQAARTRDTRPALAVSGAPAGSQLVVDGLEVGSAAMYDGRPNVLRLEPGTHDVAVRGATGGVILQQKVFLESELKTIEVH